MARADSKPQAIWQRHTKISEGGEGFHGVTGEAIGPRATWERGSLIQLILDFEME